jgi:cytochrome b
MTKVRVWDLPTRFFHWSLAILILCLVITGNVGGNAMVWHFRCGYAVLSLLLFRLMWGVVGGHWSRWRQLSCTPSALRAYISAMPSPRHYLGHNPLGSLSVLVIMGLLALQVGTGLFSDDEIANAGPLTVWASEGTIALATKWHKGFGKTLVLIMVAIHLLAIAWHFFKLKENLPRAMLQGDKPTDTPAIASSDTGRDWVKALVCLAVASGLVFLLINTRTVAL